MILLIEEFNNKEKFSFLGFFAGSGLCSLGKGRLRNNLSLMNFPCTAAQGVNFLLNSAAASFIDNNPLLKNTLAQIEKEFGLGSIMPLGSDAKAAADGIPSGSLSVDLALGGKGFPRGRIIEVFGPESSGKTTLALHVIAEAQKLDGVAAFIDAEHALDLAYASRLGVNVDDLLVSQPDFGEQALEITEILIRSGSVDVIVIDSVAALVPKAEIDGNIGDSHMGLQARLMSQAMRKLTGILKRTNTALIFINQIRMKIGVMFGNPETTTGGNALKFYSSMRFDIRRQTPIKDGPEVIGNRTKVKIVKNKVAPPFKIAEFDIIYGEGISKVGDTLDLAVGQDIVDKSGAWYSYDGERIGQGRENAKEFLKEHPEMTDDIERKVKLGFGLLVDSGEESKEEVEEKA